MIIMQKSMILHLAEEDMADAKRYCLTNVLLYLTSNRTGTLWRMGNDNVLVEIMPPYRSLRFVREEEGAWRLYRLTNDFAPCILRA